MLQLSDTANAHLGDGDEAISEADEPPDDRRLAPGTATADMLNHQLYTKSNLGIQHVKKESLLTRALLSPTEQSNDPFSASRHPNPSMDRVNQSGPSTAELTSDSGATSPLQSHSPSPPHTSQCLSLSTSNHNEKPKPVAIAGDPPESEVEASLGRKRCIKFACGRKLGLNDEPKALSDTAKDAREPPAPIRKSALTFACPAPSSRPSAIDDSGAPQQPTRRRPSIPSHARRPQPSVPTVKSNPKSVPASHTDNPSRLSKSPNITVTGLGDFQPSDATRFHEFGSSLEEDEDWVNEATHHKPKITFSDCMRKENAIRRLGEEVEEEARQNEDDEDDEDDEDEDDDDDDGDDDDEDDSSHDGNESDNEAGFASDDDSDNDSEDNFWTSASATAATSVDQLPLSQLGPERRPSDSSIQVNDQEATPLATRKPIKAEKLRPGTPNLPDSTDFVCGTFDEDRPLEAAYKSCMEERRRSKYVTLPQDIDPSFPTSDPENDNDDDDDDLGTNVLPGPDHNRLRETLDAFEFRGREKGTSSRTSPDQSPGTGNRQRSPLRKSHARSPRRLRSPPPPGRLKSPPPPRRPSAPTAHPVRPAGINITGLAQRPTRVRTKSLPRTPNPFFARLEQLRRSSKVMAAKPSRDCCHTRGAVDIVAGLEKKRQKRKEKFWRQHCRKVAKEQLERRPLPGRGAERMKELGLEVAERFRAYGFGQDTQLVLSI